MTELLREAVVKFFDDTLNEDDYRSFGDECQNAERESGVAQFTWSTEQFAGYVVADSTIAAAPFYVDQDGLELCLETVLRRTKQQFEILKKTFLEKIELRYFAPLKSDAGSVHNHGYLEDSFGDLVFKKEARTYLLFNTGGYTNKFNNLSRLNGILKTLKPDVSINQEIRVSPDKQRDFEHLVEDVSYKLLTQAPSYKRRTNYCRGSAILYRTGAVAEAQLNDHFQCIEPVRGDTKFWNGNIDRTFEVVGVRDMQYKVLVIAVHARHMFALRVLAEDVERLTEEYSNDMEKVLLVGDFHYEEEHVLDLFPGYKPLLQENYHTNNELDSRGNLNTTRVDHVMVKTLVPASKTEIRVHKPFAPQPEHGLGHFPVMLEMTRKADAGDVHDGPCCRFKCDSRP